MADDNTGPRLVRPIPRRPFRLDVSNLSPTPPSDQQPSPSSQQIPQSLASTTAFARLLGTSFNSPNAAINDAGLATPPAPTPSLSRTQSVANLGSTLFGIFSQVPSSATNSSSRFPGEDADTPWGTGAQTPVRRPGLDEGTLELMRKRAHSASVPALSAVSPRGIGSSGGMAAPGGSAGIMAGAGGILARPSRLATLLPVRLGLLFLLGMGYGVLVTHLHDKHNLTPFASEAAGFVAQGGHYQPKYLGFWGAMGVLFGLMLPWFDAVWDRAFGGAEARTVGTKSAPTGWALVVRGIGAFIGIVFAIRRLPWTSTFQASMTLALTSPFLWYLVDRSKQGFALSAAVGLIGTTVLLSIDPNAIPTMAPTILPPSSIYPSAVDNFGEHNASSASSAALEDASRPALVLGGMVRKDTVEMGVWMVSVLFCSCVCFGNVGRRLAPTGGVRGRGVVRRAGAR